MIVMKFGGSSLQSASSLTQVASIVRSEHHRLPIIVASAAGDTTDHLLHLMAEARGGRTLACLRVMDLMRDHHLSICETLLHDYHRESLERYLQASFRDLHVRTLEVCEGERVFTPELQDSVVSLGEQWSSRLLAEMLDEHCSPAIHMDSRKLILTDDHFTEAVPLYPETFANIRWLLPALARQKLVVVGGFIGANSEGRTTTLGRGGSDFTAAIIGAAIHADEVQVWKDVDGMLSCDPRVLRGGRPVEQLSYREATELAESGATILHPKTMEPAKEFGIPILIRNTFCPSNPGTRIDGTRLPDSNSCRSIAVRKPFTLLEISPTNPAESCDSLVRFCRHFKSAANVLFSNEHTAYIAVDQSARLPEGNILDGTCLKVRILTDQAIITLVGSFCDRERVAKDVADAVAGTSAFLIPSDETSCAIRLSVRQNELERCVGMLHRTLFVDADRESLTAATAGRNRSNAGRTAEARRLVAPARRFQPSMSLVQAN